jgi:hypothetical protein
VIINLAAIGIAASKKHVDITEEIMNSQRCNLATLFSCQFDDRQQVANSIKLVIRTKDYP